MTIQSTLKGLFLFVLIYLPASVIAQNGTIFRTSARTPYTLSGQQFIKYQKVALSDFYQDLRLIEVDNLNARQSNGKVSITLPNFQCGTITWSARTVEYTDDNNYYWYGIVTTESDDPCSDGSLALFARNGEKFGHLLIDSVAYEFHDLGGGVQVMAKVNGARFSPQECGVNASTPDYSVQSDTSARIEPCVESCETRVFIYFTQAAQNAEVNINNRIALAIAQVNQAYDNSLVLPQNARLTLAGSALLPGFTESVNGDADVRRFSARPDVQAMRINARADLMIILTNGNYNEGLMGVVQAIGPDFNNAYGLVQTGAATTGHFVFAHEVGHLYGGRHDNDPNATFNRGYVFRTGWFIFTRRRRTIMTIYGGGQRILNYSNPDVRVGGSATGTDTRNNARQLNFTGCQVGNFFGNTTPPVSANIVGPAAVCACGSGGFEANVRCGTAPYTFQWAYSNDGINYVNAGSNYWVYNHSFPCSFVDYVFIRVIVRDATGNSITLYHTVRVVPPGSKYMPQPCNLHETRVAGSTAAIATIAEKSAEQPFLINLVPNPAGQTVRIEVVSKTPGLAKVVLVNSQGNFSLPLGTRKIPAGTTFFTANVGRLPPGSYTVNVQVGAEKTSKILIVNR